MRPRLVPAAVLIASLLLVGCGAGGDKIEPEKKGSTGSPILNHSAAAPPPATK